MHIVTKKIHWHIGYVIAYRVSPPVNRAATDPIRAVVDLTSGFLSLLQDELMFSTAHPCEVA
jgi:hypothetical protein